MFAIAVDAVIMTAAMLTPPLICGIIIGWLLRDWCVRHGIEIVLVEKKGEDNAKEV